MPVSTTVKIGLALLVIGALIFIIGFSTTRWSEMEYSQTQRIKNRNYRITVEENFGLWRRCFKATYEPAVPGHGKGGEVCHNLVGDVPKDPFTGRDYYEISDEFRAAQFFETVALLLLIPVVLLLVLSLCKASCQDRRILPIIVGVLLIVTAGCVFLGAIIFGTMDQSRDLSWSFALAIVGGVFFGLAGVIVLVGVILKK